MTTSLQKEKINLSHAKALKRAREMMKVTRIEMGRRLNLSIEAIKKYEKGGAVIDERKIQNYLNALDLTNEDYQKIKKGKGISRTRKKKTVFTNQERRSYCRIITKEVRVLRILRQMKNLSQDQASSVCGYSRPSIGHIENGRITLDQNRIEHIVESYGHPITEFDRLMREEIIRDEILDEAFDKIRCLSEDKLKIVSSLLKTL
ncbi:MAG: helix-turn-helix transcriptional regulator [Bacteriovoracaceae bacterium]